MGTTPRSDRITVVRAGQTTRELPSSSLAELPSEIGAVHSVLSSLLPWILAVVIVAVVAVACRFAEEHPRSGDPPDSGEEDGRDPLPAAA